jgi:hypothetical protein
MKFTKQVVNKTRIVRITDETRVRQTKGQAGILLIFMGSLHEGNEMKA